MKTKFLIAFMLLGIAKGFSQQPEVIYHLFQRSFYDSNGDLHGDLTGIREKLDYLGDLGVTSVLLMPLYESDFYHNYFAIDFEKIDGEFGSMTDYLNLVKEMHEREMKIYQDVEMQYVTHEHIWYTESFGKPSSPYDNYVYYYDDQNLKPYFFFDIPEFTTYNNLKQKIAVVNMNDPAVRDYTLKVLKYWVDPNEDGVFDDGVDGFRFDHMMDDLDNSGKLTNLFEKFWTPILTELRKINPELTFIAEQANWASFGFDYFMEAEVDAVFAFRLKFAIESFDKRRIMSEADSTFLSLPPGKQQVVFIENHDTRRFASGDGMSIPKLKAAAAMNILMGGIPLIYYGQELGMRGEQRKGMTDGNDIPIREAFEWYRSTEGTGMAYWYKDTSVWWDSTNVKANDGISIEEQYNDPASLWNYYKTLIALKKDRAALASGQYRSLHNDNDSVLSFLRYSEGEQIMVLVNLSGQQQAVTADSGNAGFTRARSAVDNTRATLSGGQLNTTLPPYGVAVWELLN
ncbi:MAG TPA: alpha-amylase family glycosyl hydrolase [Cyclobacteriaceae bacterium]|nr:alpha-amylase family glycosyl hydrolase [Cyclobacteriaceae bacterium]